MKYVVFRIPGETISQEVPVIFPDQFVHSLMAEALQQAIVAHLPEGGNVEVVSAGDIRIRNAICSGKSSTLQLRSRGKDTFLVLTMDHLHGLDTPEEPSEPI